MSAKILKVLAAQAATLGLTPEQIAAVAALAGSAAQKRSKGSEPSDPLADRLEYAIKRREAALHKARIMLSGADGKTVKGQGRGGVVQPVDVRIAQLEAQIANLRDARARAEQRIDTLPGDIATLREAYEAAKRGETVAFPKVSTLDDDAAAGNVPELELAEAMIDASEATADTM